MNEVELPPTSDVGRQPVMDTGPVPVMLPEVILRVPLRTSEPRPEILPPFKSNVPLLITTEPRPEILPALKLRLPFTTTEPRPEIPPALRLRSPFTTRFPAPATEPLLRSSFPLTVSVLPAQMVTVRPPPTIIFPTDTSAVVIDASAATIVIPAFAAGIDPLPQFPTVCQSVLTEAVQTVCLQRAKCGEKLHPAIMKEPPTNTSPPATAAEPPASKPVPNAD